VVTAAVWSQGQSLPAVRGSGRGSPATGVMAPSTRRLYDDTGLVFAYRELLIDAVAAGTRDSELLGARRRGPLPRVRRVTTTREGRPVEWSDDRYRSDAVNVTIHDSIGSNPPARGAGPGLREPYAAR
jgi:GntR family transcriptional regulator